MFYIKEADKKIDLAETPIFTACPRCGAEHEIDLVEVINAIDGFDLYGTAVYCEECTTARAAERE